VNMGGGLMHCAAWQLLVLAAPTHGGTAG